MYTYFHDGGGGGGGVGSSIERREVADAVQILTRLILIPARRGVQSRRSFASEGEGEASGRQAGKQLKH